MQHLCMEGRERQRDENDSLECSLDAEENGPPIFGVSELKLELRNIARNIPLVLDSPKSESSPRKQSSCPCSSELAYPYYINFVGPSRGFLPFSADLEQPGYNDDRRRRRRIYCRAKSILNIPLSMRSFDLVIKSLRDRRKPSVASLDDFADESSSQASSTEDSAAVSPSRMLIFESLEAALKVRGALHKRSLVAPPMPRGRIAPFKRRSSSESSEPEKTTIRSRYTWTSVPPHLIIISTGLLRCMWRNGLPYFEFSVEDDDPSEVYVANPLKVRSTVDAALDYIYVFHARKGSRFAAKMKVSSSLSLSSKESEDCVETEFVLFDAADDGLPAEMQRSSSSLARTKGFSKKVAKMLTPSYYSPRRKICHKAAKSCSQFDDVHEVIAGVDELVPPRLLTDDFPASLELSAIVVKDYRHKSNKESSAGGWGLKFLAKTEAEGGRTQNSRKSPRRVNVVIPGGVHGGPITSSGGPSGLTERWKSGGLCDCGGWDVGCPITVLSDGPTVSDASPRMKSQQDCDYSIDLFMEGAKHGEPAFSLLNLGEEDLFLIRYSKSTLSAVQCFSIGVAAVHARTPRLDPKL